MTIGSEQVFATEQNRSMEQVESMRDRNYSGMSADKLREVSQEFESLFVNELFKSMRNTVPKDEWLDGGLKQDIFEDMLYSEYAKMTSKAGGIGLSDMVYDFLSRSYSNNSATPPAPVPGTDREA